MEELDYLKSLWSCKIKRKTKLIVPEVTYKDLKGFLNNENWKFKVPYAFREALDIKIVYNRNLSGC